MALDKPAVGLTPKFGNGGAIMRSRKMNAASAPRPMTSEMALNPKRDRGSAAFDIFRRKMSFAHEPHNQAKPEGLRAGSLSKQVRMSSSAVQAHVCFIVQ